MGGRPIDVVVYRVAGDMLPKLLEILRPHGRYVICGAIGGAMVEIDMRRIYLKHNREKTRCRVVAANSGVHSAITHQ